MGKPQHCRWCEVCWHWPRSESAGVFWRQLFREKKKRLRKGFADTLAQWRNTEGTGTIGTSPKSYWDLFEGRIFFCHFAKFSHIVPQEKKAKGYLIDIGLSTQMLPEIICGHLNPTQASTMLSFRSVLIMQQKVNLKQPPRKEVKFVSRGRDGSFADLDAASIPTLVIFLVAIFLQSSTDVVLCPLGYFHPSTFPKEEGKKTLDYLTHMSYRLCSGREPGGEQELNWSILCIFAPSFIMWECV